MTSFATNSPLDDVVTFIRRFVIFEQDAAADFLALWVMHTHAFEAAITTPYPRITSAERESGKTRLLEVLDRLVRRPWFAVTVSVAVVFRKGDRDAPTLLLDEVDNLNLADRGELLGVLNAGYRLGAKVPRCTDKGAIEEFDCFFPKAFCGLAGDKLPDTLHSRSVVVRLQRRKRNEAVDRFYHFEAEVQAKPIRERLEQWAVDHLYLLAAHEPQLPEQLGDRAQEVWLPLLTIADLIGGDWPARARKAAIALSGAADGDEESKGVQLLTDIRRIFAAKGAPEAIFTSELLEKLNERDESPWGTWNKGVGLRPHDLAKLLRPFTISPHQVRIGEQSKKGYRLEQFQDAWVRYLPKDRNRGNTETSLEEDDDSGLRFEVSGVSDDPGISDTEAFDEEFNRWREQLEEDR